MALSKLEIASLTLTPAFDASKYSYTVSTSNTKDKITATGASTKATVTIKVNGVAHTSGTDATWLTGINTVEVTAKYGTSVSVTTVTVTKSGTLKALTVTSAAGTELGDTKVTFTGQLAGAYAYKYLTAETITLPALDDIPAIWNDWDGSTDITATTGEEIGIIQVSIFDGRVKSAGKATVTSKA